jgi:hypothetical protein
MSRRRTGSSVPASATCPNSERLLLDRTEHDFGQIDASVTRTRLDPLGERARVNRATLGP